MATLAQKIETEKRIRDLLEEQGVPQPDFVEYGYTCIRLLYTESKLCVVIDIDEPPDGAEAWGREGMTPRATDGESWGGEGVMPWATDDPDRAA